MEFFDDFSNSSRTSNNQVKKKNLSLSIYLGIRNGFSPSDLCKKLGLKSNAIQYYLNNLKRNGLIDKIGYGVWEVKKPYKEPQKITRVTSKGMGSLDSRVLKSDSVRGHAFMFRLELPGLNNWDCREEVFKSFNLDFRPLNIHGGGQKLTFRGRKVWITNKSVIIYEKSSFLADSGELSRSLAVNEFFKLIRGLEKLLKVDFSFGGKYRFRVSRQHYALVKNALAKQFDDEGRRLQVFSSDGLWFVIDNSFNLHEAETVHAKSAVVDNRKVQDFFNGLKKFEGYTPEFVVNSIAGVSENQALYAKNIEAHINAIKELGKGVEKNNLIMEEILKLIKTQRV